MSLTLQGQCEGGGKANSLSISTFQGSLESKLNTKSPMCLELIPLSTLIVLVISIMKTRKFLDYYLLSIKIIIIHINFSCLKQMLWIVH